MKRRDFIKGVAAAGCIGAVNVVLPPQLAAAAKVAKKAGRKSGDKFDDNLVVLISDLHTNPEGHQPAKLKAVVADILAMKPLPRNVIALGDLAYLTGQVREYKALKEIISPLCEAGINLTMAMGNHDRREEFREVFPELAAKSLLKDRYLFVVETPNVDFILLDTLQQLEDKTKGVGGGALNDEQLEWIRKKAAEAQKPFFVCSHHTPAEAGVASLLARSRMCCGYIHGHLHRWKKDWIEDWGPSRVVRVLCLPSTGHWGDIGYTVMELTDSKAVATLHEKEFFFPEPCGNPEDMPEQWKSFVEEYDGETCTFVLPR